MHLIGDIGGTNIRLGLLDRGRIHKIAYLLAADFPDIQSAVRHYLAPIPDVTIDKAAFAVAGAVQGNRVSANPSHINFSIAALKSDLALDELQVMNDFEAAALAVPMLGPGDLLPIGPNDPVESKPRLLVGPGTSFGMATVIPVAGGWVVLPGEAMELPMGLHRHSDIFGYMQDHFGCCRIGHFLSGKGLGLMHEAVRVVRYNREPSDTFVPAPDVVALAKARDRIALDTVGVFVETLGHVAGSIALTVTAMGGVYLMGGVTDAIRDAGLLNASLFRNAFEKQGIKDMELRTGLLETIATQAVLAPDLGMRGLKTLLGPDYSFRPGAKSAIASPV